MSEKQTGLMKGAHPTAPGGMSQPALVEELVTKHEWDRDEAEALRWTEKIDAVCEGRLAREREADPDWCPSCETRGCGHVDPVDYDTEDGDEEVTVDDGYDPEVEAILANIAANSGKAPEEEPVTTGSHPKPKPSLLISDPDTYDYVFDGHAGAGPSASERWIHCTESLRMSRAFLETLTLNQQIEYAKSNEAARQGTTAHALGEARIHELMGTITSEEMADVIFELSSIENEAEAYSEEMEEFVSEYVDLVKQLHDEGREVRVEQRVGAFIPLTFEHEGEWYTVQGSADAIGLPTPEHPDLVVADLKYGVGHDVEVEENSQARIYALGVLADLSDDEGNLPDDLEDVTYYIIQPRLGGIKHWTESVYELFRWRDEVLAPSLTKALHGGGEFNPSEATCQWCPARGTCAALTTFKVDAAAELFDVIIDGDRTGEGFPETGTLDNATLARLLEQAQSMAKIAEDLKAETTRRMHRGEQVPGYKLVNYSPPRRWVEGAEEVLASSEHLWSTKLVTPKQAETILKKMKKVEALAELEPLIETPEKRPVVAPEDDRRKEWTGKPPEQMFGDES